MRFGASSVLAFFVIYVQKRCDFCCPVFPYTHSSMQLFPRFLCLIPSPRHLIVITAQTHKHNSVHTDSLGTADMISSSTCMHTHAHTLLKVPILKQALTPPPTKPAATWKQQSRLREMVISSNLKPVPTEEI